MKQLKQYNNSFKRQYIKIAADIRNIGFTPEIELRMQELGIVEIETSKDIDFYSGILSGVCNAQSTKIAIKLCDGSVIIVTQNELDRVEVSDKKRAIIESNIYARILNEMITCVRNGGINSKIDSFETRFNLAIKQEKQKC